MNYKDFRGFRDSTPEEPLISLKGFLTRALFVEFTSSSDFEPIYTMKSHTVVKDGKEYPSAYQVYMNSVDEYDAAMKLVGSMAHWKTLTECEWFMRGGAPGIPLGLESWRDAMKQRDASAAKEALLAAQADGNVAASKYLHEQSTKIKSPVKKKKDSTPSLPAESSVVQLMQKRNL